MTAAPDPALLKRILAEKALAHAHDTTGALLAFIHAVERFFERIFGSQAAFSTASVTRVVFFVAVGALALWLLARMLRRLKPASRRAAAVPGETDAPARLDAPEDHLTAARAARAAGDLRGAMRQHLLAALSGLEAAGRVAYGRHRTNREYVRDLEATGAADPALAASFSALVDAYDRRFYGLLPVDPAGLDAVAAAAGEVLGHLGARRRAA